MGASASKASRAAGAASRQYPKRAPTTTTTPGTSSSSSPSAAPSTQPQPSVTAQTASQPPSSSQPRPQPPGIAKNNYTQPGPNVRPPPRASGDRDEAINLDASDPDFAASLRSLGPVQPNPTLSPSSAFGQPGSNNANPRAATAAARGPNPRSNPAIAVLESRARLADLAEKEFQEAGRRGHSGREFLDVYDIRKILQLRDAAGKSAQEIERQLGLKEGVVKRLGAEGVFGMATETGRGRKDVDIV